MWTHARSTIVYQNTGIERKREIERERERNEEPSFGPKNPRYRTPSCARKVLTSSSVESSWTGEAM